MGQTLIKECNECGLGYYKPWYEPMWLGRRNWTEAHEAYHGYSQRDYGRDLERERIIKLLQEAECQGEDDWCGTIEQAIALIKGGE